MDFKHTITDKQDYTLIALKGSLIETHQADELMHEIEDLLLLEKNKFVIDLNALEFINQTGIEILYKLLAIARKNGGELTLYNLSEELKKKPEGKKIQEVLTVSENEFLAAALLV
ncbi:MAG: STAS domain-containing protein [Bacteroidia bacterium]